MADVSRFSEELQLNICNVIRLLRMKHVRPGKKEIVNYVLNRYNSYGEKEVLACFEFMEKSELIYSKNRVKGLSYFVDRNVSTNLLNQTISRSYSTVSSITDTNNFIEIDNWEEGNLSSDVIVSVNDILPKDFDHDITPRVGITPTYSTPDGNTKRTDGCYLNKFSTPNPPTTPGENPVSWYMELINSQQSTIANLVDMLQDERKKILNLVQLLGENSCIERKNTENGNGTEYTTISHTQQEVTQKNTNSASYLRSPETMNSERKFKAANYLQQQLKDTRAARHAEFLINNAIQKEGVKHSKPDQTTKSPVNEQSGASDAKHEWGENDILLTGDSLISAIEQRRLSSRNRIKVRPFSGATIEDMRVYITPLLRKNPRVIIFEIGTNNCANDTAEEIINKLRELKQYVNEILPKTVVVLCEIPIRRDNSKAEDTRKKVNAMLPTISQHVVPNDIIKETHLSKKGLHMNKKGTSLFAKIIIDFVRSEF